MTTRIPLTPQATPASEMTPHRGQYALKSSSVPAPTGNQQTKPAPVVIEARPIHSPTGSNTLSNFLQVGRQYHRLCRGSFMERRVIGYYHYERRIEYRTCVIAAAYAGAFGPESIEEKGFSYSMAIWRLSQKVGYDLNTLEVYGPTGRCQAVAREIIQLVDQDGWTREGVAEWLESLRL